MAVEIDIDLDASGATGKIGAIAASLKGLEQVANDIELDFDADIGEITDEIEDFADALGDMEVGNLSFVDDLDKAADKLDEVLEKELDLNVNGGTNNSDSTGSDPPINVSELTSDFPNFSESTVQSKTDGGKGANLLDRNYGEHTLMSNSDVADLFKTRNSRTSNLGESAPEFSPSHQMKRLGTRTGFGLEPESMNLRRMSEFTAEEINDLMKIPTQDVGGFMGTSDEPSLLDYEEIAENLRENREGLRTSVEDGIGGYDFTDFNTEARSDSDLTFGDLASDIGTSDPMDMDMRAPDLSGSDTSPNSKSLRDYLDADGDNFLKKIDGMDSKRNAMKQMGDSVNGLERRFRSLRPTMGKYMQLMAALIPVAVALGTQLLGVAAAMGSVAVAGGAIIGLGLLGHAESLTGSVAEAKAQMRSLKQEMFETFQPTMQQFAPIQARAFDRVPIMLDPVAEEMEGLTAYEDTLFNLGSALAGGMEEAVEIVNNNEQAISQLTTRFSGLIGVGILDFFEWLIQAASKNQELLIGVGRNMIKLAVVAYNLSMAITKVVSALTPFFNFLVWISGLLDGAVLLGLFAMITYLYALAKAAVGIYALAGAFSALFNFLVQAEIGLLSYITTTWGAVAATMALVGAIGLLSLGSSLLIGGAVTGAVMSQNPNGGPSSPSGSGPRRPPGGGGGTTVINDNRSYQIDNSGNNDYASQKALEGTVRKVNEENSATSLPPVNKSSDTSDSPNSTN